MRKNLKKILCGLLVIAPVALATPTLASCVNNEVKVSNHSFTDLHNVYENSDLENFDEINFLHLKEGSTVDVKVFAELHSQNQTVELHSELHQVGLHSAVVELHLHETELHLTENTKATLHEEVYVDGKIINTAEKDVFLLHDSSILPSGLNLIVRDITITSGQTANIGQALYRAEGLNQEALFVLENGKPFDAQIIDGNVMLNVLPRESDEILRGHIQLSFHGKTYETENFNISIKKAHTEISFQALENIGGKAGDKIPLGTLTATYGQLSDLTDVSFNIKDSSKTMKSEIASDGLVSISTDKSEQESKIIGTLSATVEGTRHFESEELTINLSKSDTELTFTPVENISGKAGDKILIGTFNAKYGQMSDFELENAKYTDILGNGATYDVSIDKDFKATIEFPKCGESTQLSGAISVDVNGQNINIAQGVKISVSKTDTELTFKPEENIEVTAGETAKIGTFSAQYGQMSEFTLTDAKFINDADQIKYDIVINNNNATIKFEKSNKLELMGSVNVVINGVKSIVAKDVKISVAKSDTEVTFNAEDKLEGKCGESIKLGRITTEFGSIQDLTDIAFKPVGDSSKTMPVDVNKETGYVTMQTEKSSTPQTIIGKLTTKVEGNRPFESKEMTISLSKTDTEVVFYIDKEIFEAQETATLTLGKLNVLYHDKGRGAISKIEVINTEMYDVKINDVNIGENGEIIVKVPAISDVESYSIRVQVKVTIDGKTENSNSFTIKIINRP